MAVPDAQLLVAVGGADAGVHVEDHASWRTPSMDPVDPLAGEIGECCEVPLPGQPARLEPPHLAG